MIIIEIGNSYSQIKGLASSQLQPVKQLLSYRKDLGPNSWRPRQYLIDRKGMFPTGLLDRLYEFLIKSQIEFKIIDTRVVLKQLPKSEFRLNLGPISPYPDQLAAVEVALKHPRCGIVMPTGTGKSLVIALIVYYRRVRTLIVVPTLEIKKQLQETIHTVLKGNKHVTVENIDSPKLKTNTDFDLLVLDETHHAASKTYRTLNRQAWKKAYYRVFLSATYFRNREDEQILLESIVGNPKYQISYKTATKMGYIAPVEAYYINLPKQPTEAYTWAEVYSELIVNNETRNRAIADLIKSLSSKPTLCLVREIAHGKILSELSGIPFVSGESDERQLISDFNSQRIQQLIATTGVMGEGIDSKPAEYIIIAGLGKAKSAFMQQVGRGVRRYPGKESCKVLIFRDASHKFLLRHFNAQCKILREEYGVECLELRL